MEKKVFSRENKTLNIVDEHIDLMEGNFIIATTQLCYAQNGIYLLPSNLFRKQPTDEELAEEYGKEEHKNSDDSDYSRDYKGFLSGRKSFGDKKFTKEDVISFGKWLQKEDTEENADNYFHYTDNDMFDVWLNEVHNKAIYPHTITVDFEDGVYLWETLKWEY